jgi:hypothetical protein
MEDWVASFLSVFLADMYTMQIYTWVLYTPVYIYIYIYYIYIQVCITLTYIYTYRIQMEAYSPFPFAVLGQWRYLSPIFTVKFYLYGRRSKVNICVFVVGLDMWTLFLQHLLMATMEPCRKEVILLSWLHGKKVKG